LVLLLAFPLLANALYAATVSWDGGGDGSAWHDPLNWSEDALPGATDDVAITVADAEVTYSTGAVTVQSLNCPRPLRLTGGTLTVTGDAEFGSGTLRLMGGNFAGTAVLVNGTLELSGTETSAATFILGGETRLVGNVAAGQTLRLETSPQYGHAYLRITNDVAIAGTLQLVATHIHGHSASVTVATGSTLTVQGGGALRLVNGPGGTSVTGALVNHGTVEVTGGPQTSFTGTVVNQGAIEVAEDSSVYFTGSYTGAGGSTRGPFVMAGGAVQFTATPLQPPGLLTLAGDCTLRSDLPAGQTLRLETSPSMATPTCGSPTTWPSPARCISWPPTPKDMLPTSRPRPAARSRWRAGARSAW
jgi:hypothetical protein